MEYVNYLFYIYIEIWDTIPTYLTCEETGKSQELAWEKVVINRCQPSVTLRLELSDKDFKADSNIMLLRSKCEPSLKPLEPKASAEEAERYREKNRNVKD